MKYRHIAILAALATVVAGASGCGSKTETVQPVSSTEGKRLKAQQIEKYKQAQKQAPAK